MWKVIEKYINQNRQELDLDEPGTHVWRAVEQQLNARAIEKTGMGRWRYMKAAAAVVISVGLGYLLSRTHPNNNVVLSGALDTEIACEEVNQESARLEETYRRSEEMADSAKGFDPGTYADADAYHRAIEGLRPEYQDLIGRLQQEECNRTLLQKMEEHTAKRRHIMYQFSNHIESHHLN